MTGKIFVANLGAGEARGLDEVACRGLVGCIPVGAYSGEGIGAVSGGRIIRGRVVGTRNNGIVGETAARRRPAVCSEVDLLSATKRGGFQGGAGPGKPRRS